MLDYDCFKNYYMITAIYESKQEAFDAGPKAIQQINCTGNLGNNAVMFFITEEARETVLDF